MVKAGVLLAKGARKRKPADPKAPNPDKESDSAAVTAGKTMFVNAALQGATKGQPGTGRTAQAVLGGTATVMRAGKRFKNKAKRTSQAILPGPL